MSSAPLTEPALILVLEDDQALRDSLQFRLELDGYRVETFPTGEALLDHPLPDRNALLVLDEKLPDRRGSEVLAVLRDRGVTLPAVIITSHPRPALQLLALVGRAHIIEKPLLGDALFTHIGNVLSLD